jgi:hypothetical protein
MEPRHRELIGRAAMLVMAVLLLAGSVALFRVGWRVGKDEAAQRAELRRSGSNAKTTGYGSCFVIGAGALGLGGLYFAKLALFTHRKLDENPPKAPVLWQNPEPGWRFWRGPR